MRIRKTAFTTALITLLVSGSFTTSFGSIYDDGDPTTQENINIACAHTLHDMGMLQGTDTGFELDKQTARLWV